MKKATAVLLLSIFFLFGFSDRNEKVVEEYAAKAAFVYNFTKFISWPKYESNEFNICILKECPIAKSLQKIATKNSVKNKKIKVAVVKNELPSKCQILFIPKTISVKQMRDIASYYRNKGVLIITEQRGMLDKGAGINFMIQHRKIRFEVDTETLKQSKLVASSQLLKLAINHKK